MPPMNETAPVIEPILIASFPRSGNSWTRLIVELITRRPTAGEGDGDWRERPDQPLLKHLGKEDLYISGEPVAQKRHTLRPEETSRMPLLLIVRDYRDAIYRHDKKALQRFKLQRINRLAGSYRELLDAFNACDNRKLLVRYESLVGDSLATARRIAQFMGCEERASLVERKLEAYREESVAVYSKLNGSWSKGEAGIQYRDAYPLPVRAYLDLRLRSLYRQTLAHAAEIDALV